MYIYAAFLKYHVLYELAFNVAVQHGILHHKHKDGEGMSPDRIAFASLHDSSEFTEVF